MLDDFVVAGAETACSAQWAREGSDDHVDFRCGDVLGFGKASACAAEDAIRPCFVENKAKFVFELEFDLAVVSLIIRVMCMLL